MEPNKRKAVRILIISVAILLLMVALQQYYKRNIVTTRLETILLQNENVDSVRLTTKENKITVNLTLKNVDNFKEVYKGIMGTLDQHLRGQHYDLKIISMTNPIIDDLFYNKVQFIIYEALETGEFTVMKTRLDEISSQVSQKNASESLIIKVFIDADNLFLHLKFNEINFYKVFCQHK